jgi:hypothetical protein
MYQIMCRHTQRKLNEIYLEEFDVLTATVMKNSILWDVTFKAEPCFLPASRWLVAWFIL